MRLPSSAESLTVFWKLIPVAVIGVKPGSPVPATETTRHRCPAS